MGRRPSEGTGPGGRDWRDRSRDRSGQAARPYPRKRFGSHRPVARGEEFLSDFARARQRSIHGLAIAGDDARRDAAASCKNHGASAGAPAVRAAHSVAEGRTVVVAAPECIARAVSVSGGLKPQRTFDILNFRGAVPKWQGSGLQNLYTWARFPPAPPTYLFVKVHHVAGLVIVQKCLDVLDPPADSCA